MTHQNQAFLEPAALLGRRLCRDALWAGERCNWLGDSIEFIDNVWSLTHRTLGPDLYGGTSGIALFLGRLYRLTAERLFRITAEGAIRHAQARVQDIPLAARMAFYSGWTGIGYTMTEVGDAICNEELIERGFELIGEAARDTVENPGLDVIGGSAGAIPALLRLHRRNSSRSVLPLAISLGEYLLTTARRSDVGWSWNTLDGQTEHDLTGFAHGAAGIAWGLLELYAQTGDMRFREAAEHGFEYERQWFSNEHENWPDFRKNAVQVPEGGTSNFAMAWCHGAPGIGLSRLRAYEILKSDDIKREAEAAIRTTTRVLTHPAYGDFTLCHGRGGNAELLIYAGEVLGDNASQACAEALGQQGIESFSREKLPWPCGVPGGGETPNLMLGLAGIGYFYLRLFDPIAVPSILILCPPLLSF